MNTAIELIEFVLFAVERGAAVLPKLMQAARQAGELTPEQERAYIDRMEKAMKEAHWKTDDQLADEGL
jgi:polyhydroxyalkanoate synthesis regulator phasin